LLDYHPELSIGSKYTYKDSRWNLGDSLGFVVVSYMLEKKGLSLDTWVRKRKHLGSIGSYVFTSFQHLTIWGGGALFHPKDFRTLFYKFLCRYPFSKYDFRAVRGPLTRNAVMECGHKCPEVYGDPAILMPYIYSPQYRVTRDILVIPQFYTEAEFRQKNPDLYMISMNTDDYKSVIDAIVSSKKVITSSLHGIILAESYGVPAVFFRGLGKRIDFKYLDYYYSTGRKDVKIAESFEEALEMEPMPLPDLSELQEGLLKSFPYDLWDIKKTD
jgi:pyruvyltransferase